MQMWAGVSPGPVQTWQRQAQSWCRRGGGCLLQVVRKKMQREIDKLNKDLRAARSDFLKELWPILAKCDSMLAGYIGIGTTACADLYAEKGVRPSPRLRRDRPGAPRLLHICTGTGRAHPTSSTSAPGPAGRTPPPPHLHRDRAHPSFAPQRG